MSAIAQVPSSSSPPHASPLSGTSVWLAVTLVLVIAVLIRHAVVANTDVSWLLTLGEKVLAGERPYIDFIEVNPPASIYLYLPAVVIARVTGIAPERVTDALVFLAIGGSLWLAGRVLLEARLLAGFNRTMLIASAGIILAVLPAQTFGEREHIGVILFLPMLSVLLARVTGCTVRPSLLMAAGLGAGAMMVVKPHMALGYFAALLAAAYRVKSPRILLAPENWIAASVALAYAATVMILFPDYLTQTVPILRATYVTLRLDLWDLLFDMQAFPIWMVTLVALALLRLRRGWDHLSAILLSGSAGFAAAFLVQGKGWPYHSYPMLALAFFALAAALAERRAEPLDRLERGARILGIAVVPVAASVAFSWMDIANTVAPLNGVISAMKPHPTVLTITPDISIGHPLVREIGGTWGGRVGSLWITGTAVWRREHQTLSPEEQAQIDRYVALDRSLLIDALRRSKPDIVLIPTLPVDWNAWARKDPEIADLLKPYREALIWHGVLVLERTDDRHPTPAGS